MSGDARASHPPARPDRAAWRRVLDAVLRGRMCVVACVLAVAPSVVAGNAPMRTVCTVTVNSEDEREVLRRALPEGRYRFVELVERGRPDWLESACRSGVRCDVLVVSGHFDGESVFFTDRTSIDEHLPVAELERVACSESCPGVLSGLQEVYLFGCNTLDPEPRATVPGEVRRGLLREGHAPAVAARRASALGYVHGGSSRERMRDVFRNVPVIYGFTAKAPLGHIAGPILERYFRTGPVQEFGSGTVNATLLRHFAAVSMSTAPGMTEADVRAEHARDVCRFVDQRLDDAARVRFVHEMLRRSPAEARMFLARLERFASRLPELPRDAPETVRSLDALAADGSARERYLALAADADEPEVRARMLLVAMHVGWLDRAGLSKEYVRVLGERLASGAAGPSDIDLACRLHDQHPLDPDDLPRLPRSSGSVVDAATRACLGDATARATMLTALASANDADVELARVYVRHRPVADAKDYRRVTVAVARMTDPDAQARALETLARQPVSDDASTAGLVRVYADARSADVQRAIARILILVDHGELDREALTRTLRERRVASAQGTDIIDILIRRLEAH